MNLKEIKNRTWYKPVITFLQILIDIIGLWIFTYLLYISFQNNASIWIKIGDSLLVICMLIHLYVDSKNILRKKK
jgi:hypothetical protein